MDADIIIAGGGLVGNALAIALARGGLAVTLADPSPRAQQVAGAFDGRTSAIAQGSVRVLRRIGVWARLEGLAQPIHDIRVCDQDHPGAVHYSDREVGEPFGYIVENRYLREALYATRDAQPGITALESSVEAYEAQPGAAQVTFGDGSIQRAPLLIAADGRFSALRAQAGLGEHVIRYGQCAIVCTIAHSEPHHGLALEKFYPAGPFAVLPLTDAQGRHRSGIVWTEREADAKAYLALPADAFTAALARRIGDAQTGYWGEIEVIGPRFSYPLSLVQAKRVVAPRFALAGDAAHGIHPIAGQGVNLGYRDVAVLEELLVTQRALGLDVGDASLLARYQRWRAFDSVSMTAGTDLLNRLFSNRLPGLGLLRRAGLVAVDHTPPLKRFFMRHAMGLVGDLPRLLRADAPAA